MPCGLQSLTFGPDVLPGLGRGGSAIRPAEFDLRHEFQPELGEGGSAKRLAELDLWREFPRVGSLVFGRQTMVASC